MTTEAATTKAATTTAVATTTMTVAHTTTIATTGPPRVGFRLGVSCDQTQADDQQHQSGSRVHDAVEEIAVQLSPC